MQITKVTRIIVVSALLLALLVLLPFGRATTGTQVSSVRAAPNAQLLYSFETGTEGWAPGNWMPDAGVLSRTADFHPQGAAGLHLEVTAPHWFGVQFAEPLNLSSKSQVAYELRTGATGTSVSLAMQTGPSFTWCQSSFPFIQPNTTTTITVDLLTDFSCGGEVLGDIRGLLIFFSPGSYDIDDVRGL
jgi:mannan endo-1,4-beta-mannosidase